MDTTRLQPAYNKRLPIEAVAYEKPAGTTSHDEGNFRAGFYTALNMAAKAETHAAMSSDRIEEVARLMVQAEKHRQLTDDDSLLRTATRLADQVLNYVDALRRAGAL